MKKLKTLLCVVFVLATVICLCVSVSAAEEGKKYSSWEEWANDECYANPERGGKHKVFDYTLDATCSHEGTVYKKCEYCNWMYLVGTKEKLPHKLTIETGKRQEPTCTEAGWKELKCEVCGALRKETIPSSQAEHKWIKDENGIIWKPVLGKEPTCNNVGEVYRKCEVCGTIETKPSDEAEYVRPEHKWEDVDCVTQQCSECWQKQVKEGASHGEIVYSTLGAFTTNGIHTGNCSVCGKELVRGNHVIDDHDCTTEAKCGVCGVKLLDQVPQTEHNKGPIGADENGGIWDYVETADGMHSRKCSNPGCDQPTHVDEHKAGEGDCPLCKASAPVTPDETTNEPAADEPKPVEPTVTVEGVAEPATVTAAEAPAVAAKYKDYVAYNIEAEIVGGVAKVSIPIPEGWDNVKVYHVDGDTLTDMNATVVDGNAVFTTNHFSVYAIVNVDTDLDNQNQTSASTDAPATDTAEPTTDAPAAGEDEPTTDAPTAGAPATDAPATDEPVGDGDIAPAPGDGSVIAPAPETDGETVAPKLGDSDLPMLLTVIAVGAAAAFVSIAAVKKQRGE